MIDNIKYNEIIEVSLNSQPDINFRVVILPRGENKIRVTFLDNGYSKIWFKNEFIEIYNIK